MSRAAATEHMCDAHALRGRMAAKLAGRCGASYDGSVSSVLSFMEGNSCWDPHTPQGGAFDDVNNRLTRGFLGRMVQVEGHELCGFVRMSIVPSRIRSIFYYSGPFQRHLKSTSRNVGIPAWSLMNMALSQEVVRGVQVHDAVAESVHGRILTWAYRMTWLDVFEACQVLTLLMVTQSSNNESDNLLLDPRMLKSLFCRSDRHNRDVMIDVALRAIAWCLQVRERLSGVEEGRLESLLDTVFPLAEVAIEDVELACLKGTAVATNPVLLIRSLVKHRRYISCLTRHLERVTRVLPISRHGTSSDGDNVDSATEVTCANVTYLLDMVHCLASGTSVETLVMLVRRRVFADVTRACLCGPHMNVETLRLFHRQWPGETSRVVREALGTDPPETLFPIRVAPVTTYECPVSLQPCVYPVVLSDGHTYERDSAMGILVTTAVSPITREPLTYHVVVNHALLEA